MCVIFLFKSKLFENLLLRITSTELLNLHTYGVPFNADTVFQSLDLI